MGHREKKPVSGNGRGHPQQEVTFLGTGATLGAGFLGWEHEALAPLPPASCQLGASELRRQPPPPSPGHLRSVTLVVITRVTPSPLRAGLPLIQPTLGARGPGWGADQTHGKRLFL